MNALMMSLILLVALFTFLFSFQRRLRLMFAGKRLARFDQVFERLKLVSRYAFRQEKMSYYQPAGLAHKLIFAGFLVLTLRTLMLVGRGYISDFSLWILALDTPLGKSYEFAKDLLALAVLVGVCIFFYFRVIRPQKRMTLHWEGILILAIIAAMMVADMLYDGASTVIAVKYKEICPSSASPISPICERAYVVSRPYMALVSASAEHLSWSFFPSPGGSFFAGVLRETSSLRTLLLLAHFGYWVHVCLVFVFLNLLPYSKHFHVITAIPNIAFSSLEPKGRLNPISKTAEGLMEKMALVAELESPTEAPIGVARIDHFSWKSILDFYTCTECGRCSDHCPAHRTGKKLSPKHFTLALRDHLYQHQNDILDRSMKSEFVDKELLELKAAGKEPLKTIDLVSEVVDQDVIWACTTCRACEDQCPVMISYVDKIVDMRRNLVMVRGEFPNTLQKPFQGMEVNGNPWNLSRMDRSVWSEGLEVKTMKEHPEAEVLYWVGCAASYDERAKKVARAMATLLKQAGVDFAILGDQENCTGDPARRAGNEFLFATLAEQNVDVLSGYREKGGAKTVVTTCPHCFNTLKNEYLDFGVKLDVVHHSDFLLGLLLQGKLVPKKPIDGKLVYHDSCYLGRYNDVYASPRDMLRSIPGVELVEVEYWNKSRGLCCGAGGAQMFMEEQNTDRVNAKRTLQLLDTGAKTIATGCPFCMIMVSDGLKAENKDAEIRQLDMAEILFESCFVQEEASPLSPVSSLSLSPSAPSAAPSSSPDAGKA